jgi:hypothetical protein
MAFKIRASRGVSALRIDVKVRFAPTLAYHLCCPVGYCGGVLRPEVAHFFAEIIAHLVGRRSQRAHQKILACVAESFDRN